MYTPKQVMALQGVNIVQVACGSDSTTFLSDQGDLYTCGLGYMGQLGHGQKGVLLEPGLVEIIEEDHVEEEIHDRANLEDKHTLLNAGHTMLPDELSDAVEEQRAREQEEEEEMQNALERARVSGATSRRPFFVDVATGGAHMLALSQEGEVWSWGWSEAGRLGRGYIKGTSRPRRIPFFKGMQVQDIACGGGHSFVATQEVKEDNGKQHVKSNVYAFGQGACGRLGLGKEENQYFPAPIEALAGKKVRGLIGGVDYSMCVTEEEEEA